MKQSITTHDGTKVYWSAKSGTYYMQIEVDPNGYGDLKEIHSYGDVYEEETLTNLWVNFPEFNGAEYDTTIPAYAVEFINQTFGNSQKI